VKIPSGLSRYARPVVLTLAMIQQAGFGENLPPPTSNAATSSLDSTRAQALLQRAVRHYQQTRNPELADFGHEGKFVDRELYVFIVSTAGVLLASGGPPSSLVGRNVLNQRDSSGKRFFREMLATARSNESGTVDYRWLNPIDNQIGLKIANFHTVGDSVIAVGHYAARGTPAQALTLLIRAVDALHADATQTITAINTRHGPYSQDDLYVFVVNLDSGRFRANGADARLIGTGALSLLDPSGMPFVAAMVAAGAGRSPVESDYFWLNPIAGNVERKHAFMREVDNMLVGVGYYAR
jgi:cytochrome c